MNKVCPNCSCEFETKFANRKYCYTCSDIVKKRQVSEKSKLYNQMERNGECLGNGVISVDNMIEIQRMLKKRKITKITFEDIRKRFKNINKDALKKYCQRIIKSEKDRIMEG